MGVPKKQFALLPESQMFAELRCCVCWQMDLSELRNLFQQYRKLLFESGEKFRL